MATAKQLAWRKKFARMAKSGAFVRSAALSRKRNARRRNASSEVHSPTSTDVRSPTSTRTSTEAATSGNVTVTGGAGAGATTDVGIYRTNPKRRKVIRKNPSAKQIAWRKKFAKMAKSGQFVKGTAKRRTTTTAKRTAANPTKRKAAAASFRKFGSKSTKGKLSKLWPRGMKKATRKKNPLSVVRNGKRIYGAAAQAVLQKRANGAKRKTNSAKRPAAKRRNSLTSFPGAVPVRKYFRSGGRVSAWKDAEKRGQQRLFSMNGRRRKRNSASSTDAAYQQFQGRAVASTIDVLIPDTAPKDVYVLGCLTEIKTSLDHITFDEGDAYLVADKDDNLYIGATKATNAVFEANENIGEIKELSYITVKDHMEGQPIEYVHKMAEEGGTPPALITNEKRQLEIIGGTYYITADGLRD